MDAGSDPIGNCPRRNAPRKLGDLTARRDRHARPVRLLFQQCPPSSAVRTTTVWSRMVPDPSGIESSCSTTCTCRAGDHPEGRRRDRAGDDAGLSSATGSFISADGLRADERPRPRCRRSAPSKVARAAGHVALPDRGVPLPESRHRVPSSRRPSASPLDMAVLQCQARRRGARLSRSPSCLVDLELRATLASSCGARSAYGSRCVEDRGAAVKTWAAARVVRRRRLVAGFTYRAGRSCLPGRTRAGRRPARCTRTVSRRAGDIAEAVVPKSNRRDPSSRATRTWSTVVAPSVHGRRLRIAVPLEQAAPAPDGS